MCDHGAKVNVAAGKPETFPVRRNLVAQNISPLRALLPFLGDFFCVSDWRAGFAVPERKRRNGAVAEARKAPTPPAIPPGDFFMGS